jgi:hypothetical protein
MLCAVHLQNTGRHVLYGAVQQQDKGTVTCTLQCNYRPQVGMFCTVQPQDPSRHVLYSAGTGHFLYRYGVSRVGEVRRECTTQRTTGQEPSCVGEGTTGLR